MQTFPTSLYLRRSSLAVSIPYSVHMWVILPICSNHWHRLSYARTRRRNTRLESMKILLPTRSPSLGAWSEGRQESSRWTPPASSTLLFLPPPTRKIVPQAKTPSSLAVRHLVLEFAPAQSLEVIAAPTANPGCAVHIILLLWTQRWPLQRCGALPGLK